MGFLNWFLSLGPHRTDDDLSPEAVAEPDYWDEWQRSEELQLTWPDFPDYVEYMESQQLAK